MRSRTVVRTITLLLLVVLGDRVTAQPLELGHTEFPNSGAATAQEPFLRGLLLLHSFEYSDAREEFQRAQQLDRDFAMAYWGEAMTHNHPLWRQQDREAALEALGRLGATSAERLGKAPTEREKDYLRTLDVLYGEGEKRSRDRAYAEAMRRLAETYPNDLDAVSFQALAILGTASEGRDFRTYMRAAAVVEEVFATNPRHPGAAHYLIHSYDDPVHAPLGLRAARVYATIAPAAAHALHMPSHIFVAMGMWEDVVASNEDSWAAAEGRVERKKLGIDERGYHALHWLAYGYLQQGRYQDARRLLEIMREDAEKSGSRRTRSHLVAIRSDYIVNTRQWDPQPVNVDTSDLEATDLFVTGLSALKKGQPAVAEKRLSAMQQRRRKKTSNGYDRGGQADAVLEQELEAILLLARGDADGAVQLMRQAAAAEDEMPFSFGPPDPVKPAHELFGEMLLEVGRPQEAIEQFQLALERTPRRALSLLGLARAAVLAGDRDLARQAKAELREIWRRADSDLPDRTMLKETAALAVGQ